MNWVKRHRIITSIILLPLVMFVSGVLVAEAGGIGVLFLMVVILGLVLFVLNGRKEEVNNAKR